MFVGAKAIFHLIAFLVANQIKMFDKIFAFVITLYLRLRFAVFCLLIALILPLIFMLGEQSLSYCFILCDKSLVLNSEFLKRIANRKRTN